MQKPEKPDYQKARNQEKQEKQDKISSLKAKKDENTGLQVAREKTLSQEARKTGKPG